MMTVVSRQEEVRKLVESLADPDQRKSVANALSNSNPKLAIKTLNRAMDLDDPVLRLRALEMIEIIGNHDSVRTESVDLMIRISRTDSDWGVRRLSTVALGNLKMEKAIPSLIQRLADDDPRVHEAAIDALRKMGSKTTPYLQLELQSDNALFLKWRCIELVKILEIPNLAMIRQLVMFINDREQIIRDEAIAAIERFRQFFYEDLHRVESLLEHFEPTELDGNGISTFFEILVSDKDAFKIALKSLVDSGNIENTKQFVELLKQYYPS